MFQFTHPGKGATVVRPTKLVISMVSIHAPWEGCDGLISFHTFVLIKFQFTHPGKGATRGGEIRI